VNETHDVVYAGFIRRWGAIIIDGFILGIGFYVVLFVGAIAFGVTSAAKGMDPDHVGAVVAFAYVGFLLLYYASAACYYALQESSSHQATLGKRAMGIKVTDAQGRRLGRAQAFGRWFAAALSYLTLYIGFLMAAFTERKRALHDIVADTLVVDRWAFTDTPERQQRHVGVAAIVVAIAAVFLLVAMLGILAAIAIPAYQDYTMRAKVTEAMSTAAPLKTQVAGFFASEGRCPANGEGGVADAGSYANARIASIATGAMQGSGLCAIEVTLRDSQPEPLDGKRVWLEYQPSTGAWQCSSEIKKVYLPHSCRE
jgi:uncharacterized RDD family membrane protein YckC/Tfp pilus assembly major pilin PilA